MVKYEYTGEEGREFPSVPITVKKGDTFEGPEGLVAYGLKVVSSSSATAVKEIPVIQEKKTTTPSAPTDISAGA